MRDIIELKQTVDAAIDPLVVIASAHRCRLLNHISPGTSIITDREAFLFIMKRLLRLIIDSSCNSIICISELKEGNSLLIRIKDDNNDYKGFISGKMEKHQSILRRAGCSLNFEFRDKRSITVILHFVSK